MMFNLNLRKLPSQYGEVSVMHKNLVQIGTVVSEISSPKGNDRLPENKQVFLNSSQVSKRFFFN